MWIRSFADDKNCYFVVECGKRWFSWVPCEQGSGRIDRGFSINCHSLRRQSTARRSCTRISSHRISPPPGKRLWSCGECHPLRRQRKSGSLVYPKWKGISSDWLSKVPLPLLQFPFSRGSDDPQQPIPCDWEKEELENPLGEHGVGA